MKLSLHLKKIIALLVSLWIIFTIIIIQLIEIYRSSLGSGILNLNDALTYIIAFIMIAFIFRWYKKYDFNIKKNISEYKIVLLLFFAVFLPRYLMISNFSLLQISDYGGYLNVSQALFKGDPISNELKNYMSTVAVNQLLISKIFSFSYYIWGDSVFSPLMLNMGFTFLYTYLFYKICSNYAAQKLSLIGAICLALWPENILNSIYMLSEPMFMMFLFSGVLFYIKAKARSDKYSWILIGLSGIFLGISNQLRSITIIFIITFAILVFCDTKNKKGLFQNLMKLLVLLCFCNLVKLGYLYYAEQMLGGVIAAPAYGWPIYLGTNTTNWGSWSEDAANTLTQARNNYPVEFVQKVMLQKAIVNISSYDFKTVIQLVLNKMCVLLGRGDGTYRDLQYIFSNTPEQVINGSMPAVIWSWGSVSNFIYVMLLNGCLLSSLPNSPQVSDKLFFQLPLCGIMMLHCLIYVSPRYQYPLIPLLLGICIINLNPSDNLLKKGGAT